MGHENAEWIGLYHVAILELEHAKMTGRIGDARTSITARIEKLKDMPGLHAEERQAMEDALNGLKVLEREDQRYQAEEQRIAARALEDLRRVAHKFPK
jgi:hypothetical protein